MHRSNHFNEQELTKIERTTREVGREIFARIENRRPSVFERRWWDDALMSWAMQDDSVKVQMFRFVDVLPMLSTSDAVARHLQEYFAEVSQYLPGAARLGLKLAPAGSIGGRALALAARRNVIGQARRFIAGSNAHEVLAAAMRERKLRRAFTLDLLGEAVTSDIEANRYQHEYLSLLTEIAPVVNAWPEVPQIDRELTTEVPRVNVSLKLSALDSRFDPLDSAGTTRRVAERLRPLLRRARELRAFVNIDMESFDKRTLTFEIFKQVLDEAEFHDLTDVGIVVQAYLRDAADDLQSLAHWARGRGTPVWVRLVKGAYWDYETVHARSVGWPVPVFEQKAATDANFERLTRQLFAARDWLRPAIASHNVRSLAHAIAVARHLGVAPSAFELQLLYGMGDPIKQALVNVGHRVRVYMPFGELIPGMAYLVRRLLENTSNDSFLRASFTESVSPEKLLMNPEEILAHDRKQRSSTDTAAIAGASSNTEAPTGGPFAWTFKNTPPTDFALAANRDQMQRAIAEVRRELGRHAPLWIDGEKVETTEQIISVNPSRRHEVIGTAASASQSDVDRAVAAARRAFAAWSAKTASERAELLRRVAAYLRERRFSLAAWMVLEAGKPWREADADVAEAIDFCEFYASGAEALARPHGVDVPGEENRFEFLARGVTAVIAPWNFPLAILTGMTTAALATGNTVVMKPAEQTPLVAAQLMDAFIAAGFPPGVVNYLPGPGETAGAALVDHRDVALVAFTGSRAVGLAINRRAAEVSAAGGRFVKRVIAEMGGKNAVVVDDDADLDEAVLAVVGSAFSYQGQKCSACSRVIVVASIYDTFLARLVEATRSLKVGPADEPATDVGPLIDEESQQRVLRTIADARQGGREMLAADGGPTASEGFFVGPHIFADVDRDAPLAQDEIFGPVLAVLRAADFSDAIAIVNDSAYALTAGVFSRSPEHLEQARREIAAGNLYLNRGITGALVGRQPFGGYKLSGIGSQAGGREYLLQFVIPRTITENTMRRGFAPASSHADQPGLAGGE
jgi:RHH-type proline utilization regulon transcriptional repressor/proline dehydrogenase/delta 1-pyrroline-5-carboxylate dehydrogenase